MTTFIAAWWLLGICGGLLLWLDWKLTFPNEAGRCPTRKVALGIVLGGLFGPCALFAGLIVMLIRWLSRPDGWWSKPIC